MMFVNIYKIESLDKIRWNVVLFAVISVLALFFIGLLLASLISAFSVPAFNILAVISLSAFNRTESNGKKTNLFIHILKEIVKNPLIQGVALGMFCVIIRPFFGGWRFSTGNLRFIFKAFEALGSIAPWFSLIILGGQFKFSSVKRLLPQISVSVFARLILATVNLQDKFLCGLQFFQVLRCFCSWHFSDTSEFFNFSLTIEYFFRFFENKTFVLEKF